MDIKAKPDESPAPPEPKLDSKQLWKSVLEIAPILIFFVGYRLAGIYVATGAFMAATMASLACLYWLLGRLPLMPVVSGGLVLLFGSLTIWLQDDFFIKIKVTFVYALFAIVLLGGLALGRPLLKYVLGEALELKDEGWSILTLRWGLFFVFMAALNEFVWRNYSTDVWVSFKGYGLIFIPMAFALAQVGIIQRYRTTPK